MSDTSQQRTSNEATDTSQRDTDRTEKQTDKHADKQKAQTSKTAGTNRDFDDSGESQNQAHGHPREERARESKR